MRPGSWFTQIILATTLFLPGFQPPVSRYEGGDPFIHNFRPEEYKGSAQIFGAFEDNQGRIYFATNEGILIYNGLEWSQITLPNRSRISHIEGSQPGKIFISATAEFGQLVVSSRGDIEYESFRERLPEAERDFQEVYHCYAFQDHRFFMTRDRIFCIGEKETSVFPCQAGGGIRINQSAFIIQRNIPGLFSLDSGGLHPMEGSSELGIVFALRRTGETEFLIVSDRGKYRYDTNDSQQKHRFRKAKGALADLAGDLGYSLFIRLKPGLFALGKPGLPFRLVDSQGHLLNEIGKKNGLLSDNIYHILLDRFGNLWVSQNVGLSYIELSSPLSRFSTERGLEGMVTASSNHHGIVYASNFYGIHNKVPGQENFTHLEGTSSPCFSFHVSRNDRLYASDGQRLLQVSGDQAEEIIDIGSFIYSISETPHRPGLLFLGHSEGLSAVRLSPDGKRAVPALEIEGLSGAVRSLHCDQHGDFWITVEYQGLYKLSFSTDPDRKPQLIEFSGSPPLEKTEDVFIALYQNHLYLSTSSGYYRLLDLKGPPFDFQPLQIESPPSEQGGTFLYDSSGSAFWLHRHQQLNRIRVSENGRMQIDWIPFSKVSTATVETVTTGPDNCSWICTNNGLYRFDQRKKKEYEQSFQTLITRVVVNNSRTYIPASSLDLPGTDELETKSPISLSYGKNSLHFHFSALFYEHAERNQYQHMLEGFDSEWSAWNTSSSKEYTNLPHGQYRFRIRSRNIFGTMGSTDSYSFSIATPWFLSLPSFLAYLLLAAGVLRLSIYLYTRRLTQQQRVLEQAVSERTREVEEQKRQIAEKNRILNDLATKDDLTGIANHRRIMEHYRQEWQRAVREQQPITIILADIDNFKEYNDSFGHLAGDECLIKIASAFAGNALRPADLAGRYGGEEFMMILPQTDPNGADKVAENIRKSVNRLNIPHNSGSPKDFVTISVGYVSAIPNLNMKPEQLISLADQALYRSKREGKDRTTKADFNPET